MDNQKKSYCLKNVCHGASQIQIKFVSEKIIENYELNIFIDNLDHKKAMEWANFVLRRSRVQKIKNCQ